MAVEFRSRPWQGQCSGARPRVGCASRGPQAVRPGRRGARPRGRPRGAGRRRAGGGARGEAAPQQIGPEDLPPLPSAPAPGPAPEVPKGRFTNAPPTAGLAGATPTAGAEEEDEAKRKAKEAKRKSLDPKRAKVVETTEIKKVYEHPDGTYTMELSAAPARFKDATGAWRDVDLTLVDHGGGTLKAKAAKASAALAPVATGDLVTADSSAGPVVLRHPDALRATATAQGAEGTYADALPGGRDLTVALTPGGGFKETVTLPGPQSPASYTETLTLPPGLSARSGGPGGGARRGRRRRRAPRRSGRRSWGRSRRARRPTSCSG